MSKYQLKSLPAGTPCVAITRSPDCSNCELEISQISYPIHKRRLFSVVSVNDSSYLDEVLERHYLNREDYVYVEFQPNDPLNSILCDWYLLIKKEAYEELLLIP